MYERIVTPRATPVVTPDELSSFGRFDLPEAGADFDLLVTLIEAATDQVEELSATALITEEILLTFDYFPGQADPRQIYDFQMGYSYDWAPWWWFGFPTKDSIELVRRPVQVADGSVVVKYYDGNGALQTFDAANYSVGCNKITLNVGCTWPPTSRQQDCIQISYKAGYGDVATIIPARLKMAVLFLATHFFENRSIIGVEPTSEVGMTLTSLLSSFRSMRIPR